VAMCFGPVPNHGENPALAASVMTDFAFGDPGLEIRALFSQQEKVLHLIAEQSLVSGVLPNDAFEPRAERRIITSAGQSTAIEDLLDGAFDVVVLDCVLQFIENTREFLSCCFGKCRDRGRLIVIVPDQFFDDRAWQLPSRLTLGTQAKRLYTPASLLMEIEESLAPLSHRLITLRHGDRKEADSSLTGLFLCVERVPNAPPFLPIDVSTQEAPRPPATLPIRDEKSLFDGTEAVEYFASEFNDDFDDIQEVCVLKLDHRGDFLLAAEAFSALRRLLPDARITLVCGSWNRQTAKESKVFDDVLCFDAFPEDLSTASKRQAPEDLARQFDRLMQQRCFDLAIDLRTFTDTRPLLERVRARIKAGFDPHSQFESLTIRLPYANQERMRAPTRTDGEKYPAGESGITYFEQSFRLERGRYLLEILATPEETETEVDCVVIANDGSRLPYARRARPYLMPVIELTVVAQTEDLCLMLSSQAAFRVFGVNVMRIGEDGYINQAEAMLLLVYFTGMRLRSRLVSSGRLRVSGK
jgi:hypothetical protein